MISRVWLLLWFCGLTLAQDGFPETEVTAETESCFPNMCKFLKEFGAIKEKQKTMETSMNEKQEALETKLKETEKLVLELKEKGIFAAPVAGTYYFTFFYHAGGSEAVSLALMKNNEVIVTAYDHKTSHDGADNGGNAAFLQLQQGDHVYMRLGPNTNVWGDSHITTFSGILLHFP
ncbi:complement C1q tumor necrosis factor-related protein 3-like isoform X2 [Cyprinodon tularosa]|uniref:complement C1q tumor necrosis factor-related protein 3-like isoform X2 n=1 Tax=Cyprinodon tularosa TaxID=77115 RepID=UPI0018E28E1A|nr:complement C1q tumor necrosis factor-related protein 3-like isoform X2 [Cyprinodon tularosa]